MTKAIVPKTQKKVSFIADVVKNEAVKVVRLNYKTELDAVTSPLESEIKTVINHGKEGSNYVIRLHGAQGDTATINAGGDAVSSHDLLKFLDAGTNVKYVQMPDDFGNETFPNSLGTREVDYDRDGIFFSEDPQPGIEARNWLKQINEMYKGMIRQNINRVVKAYLNN